MTVCAAAYRATVVYLSFLASTLWPRWLLGDSGNAFDNRDMFVNKIFALKVFKAKTRAENIKKDEGNWIKLGMFNIKYIKYKYLKINKPNFIQCKKGKGTG